MYFFASELQTVFFKIFYFKKERDSRCDMVDERLGKIEI